MVYFEVDSRLERIGEKAFARSTLEVFAAPPLLKILGKEAFRGCENLRAVVLNAGLQVIGDSCFEETSIEWIGIPTNVREIGTGAFRGC